MLDSIFFSFFLQYYNKYIFLKNIINYNYAIFLSDMEEIKFVRVDNKIFWDYKLEQSGRNKLDWNLSKSNSAGLTWKLVEFPLTFVSSFQINAHRFRTNYN